MIGDRIHDAIAARANDVAFIGVTYGYGSTAELDDAGPWPRVDSPSALLPPGPPVDVAFAAVRVLLW